MPVAGQNGYIASLPTRNFDPAKPKPYWLRQDIPLVLKLNSFHATGDF
jgi:hypothetical protein